MPFSMKCLPPRFPFVCHLPSMVDLILGHWHNPFFCFFKLLSMVIKGVMEAG